MHSGVSMKDRELLYKMELNDLWDLHQRIIDVLDRKLESEKSKLQNQLDELGRRFGGDPKDLPQRRPCVQARQVDFGACSFRFRVSIQNVNDPLMQVPEVIQLQSYIVIHGPSCPCRSYRR